MSAPDIATPRFTLNADDFPRSLTWSVGGEELAWGTASGRVQVVAAASGATTATAELEGTGVAALAWHPRERLLCAGAEDGSVWLVDPGSDKLTRVVPPGRHWTEHIAWNPKGSKLAVAVGRGALVLATDGRLLVHLPEVESTISGITWSPDGAQVACASYGGVTLFDPKSGKRRRRLPWRGSIISLAWRPGGQVIAGGCQDNSVHFWRLPAGKDSQMSGYPAKPRAISWSHDGRLLATSGAPQVTVWKFQGRGPEGTTPIELSAHEQPVSALAFAPVVDILASGCRDGRGYLWAPEESARPVRQFAMAARIEALQWTLAPAEQNVLLAAADTAGRVAVWALR